MLRRVFGFAWVCAIGLAFGSSPDQTADNLIVNAGFEKPLPQGWFGLWEIDPKLSSKGAVAQTLKPVHAGIYALKLTPNSTNTSQPGYLDYGVAQRLPVDQYRGKPLLFQAWMGSMGGATALLRIVAVPVSGATIVRVIRLESLPSTTSVTKLALQRDVFDVPDVPLKDLFLVCSVQGASGRAYFDDVVVSNSMAASWTMGQPDPGAALNARVEVNFYGPVRKIPKTLWGMNIEYPFSGYGLWNPEIGVLDDHMLTLANDLSPAMWRFPGGLYANYYHWQDAIGPAGSRPPELTLPQTGYSDNFFGTDEALQFSRATNTPLFITVNAHTGTADEAASWVQYINGNSDNPRVDYWEIGNELYFYQNPADTSGPVWTPEAYSDQFLMFASAMRAADPSIKLAADIEFNLTLNGCGVVSANGCWTDVVLKRTARQVDVLALHNGLAPIMIGNDAGWDARTVYAGMLAGPLQVKSLLSDLSRKVDALNPADAARIKFAMVEWGPLFQSDPSFRFIDHPKTLASGLYTAGIIKTLLEEPRMEIAHGFTLVDPWTAGWIGPRAGVYIPKAPYYVLQLFSKHFGTTLLQTTTGSPTYDARSMGLVPATPNVPYLDAVSSSDDSGGLSIIVTNKHFDRPISTSFYLQGYTATGGTAWTLNGSALDANTGTELPAAAGYGPQTTVAPDGRFYNGGPGEITVNSTPMSVNGSCFTVQFPPHSVTAMVFKGFPLGDPSVTSGCDTTENQPVILP